jgi:hypothetical protein
MKRAVPCGAVLGAVALLVAAPASVSAGASGRSVPSGNVIVVLRNPYGGLPAVAAVSRRAAADRAIEAPVIARARRDGVRRVHGFGLIGAFSATVTPAQASALAGDPAVAAVYPDLLVHEAPPPEPASAGTAVGGSAPAAQSVVCPSDPSHPLLEPEALQATNTAFSDTATPQAQNIVNGIGVKVAFLADGLDINNPDFIRADSSHVFVDEQDFTGEGLNAPGGGADAFGAASAIASQGRQTYDLANFVNPAHPLPAGCTIRVLGVAPGASLIGLKVFGSQGVAPTSLVVQAIEYAITDGADVIDEPLSANPFPDTGNDPISLVDAVAVADGVTVVAGTGDGGAAGTIGTPASDAAVIGVGASTTLRAYAQSTAAGAQLSNGSYLGGSVSSLSAGGVTQAARVPDLVAPGDLDWAVCTPNPSLFAQCAGDNGNPSPIQAFGGTGQSAAFTAGAAALVIEAYENTHHGVRPAPALVKRLLTSAAGDLDAPATEQGAGLLNALAAVQAAESWQDANGTPTPQGSALVVDTTQLSLVGVPGARASAQLAVTNDSGQAQTVTPSTRTLGTPTTVVTTAPTLDTAIAPAFLDEHGISRSFTSQTVSVPSGSDRLDVSVAAATGPFPPQVILIAPDGAYAGASHSAGASGFAHLDIAEPASGTWTAVLDVAESSGFDGTLNVVATTSAFTSAATVRPRHLVLQPGATGTLTLVAHEPAQPGDVSASLQLASSGGPTVSVPVTERALVPPGPTTFTGVITGGDGRAAPAQSNVYYLKVPPHVPLLGIDLHLNDPNVEVNATLTGPDGQVSSDQSDLDEGASFAGGWQLYRRDPAPGRWILSLDVANPASGAEVSAPFSAHVTDAAAAVQATGLPRGVTLAPGAPVTIPVQITNTSDRPLDYFADPRLRKSGLVLLPDLGGGTFPLPLPPGDVPSWLVPTESTSLTVQAIADQPVWLDLRYGSGNPDVVAAAVGNGASATVAADEVSPGQWLASVGQPGPFSGPAPAGSVTFDASVQTRLFDPAATSTTGDPWQGAGTPLRIPAGGTGTITVTITPLATHQTVRGVLYVDTFDGFTLGGDEIAALPYSYTVR